MSISFWQSQNGRYTIIALTYAVLAILFFTPYAAAIPGLSLVSFAILAFCLVKALPLAGRAVNSIEHAIFGKAFLFGPLGTFVDIFLIKFTARLLIAVFLAPVVGPYTIGNFIADRICAD